MPQAAQPSKPLHIFKPGRWTTMAGEAIEFSEADLQATADAYNPQVSKAPIVVGHPKSDDPAKGWAVALSASKRGLFASLDKVDPAFAESVRSGAYGTVSAKFYRPTDSNNPMPGVWYLRHIGFLGAHPPGVKGLDSPEFAEQEDGCVCFQEGVSFGEWDPMTVANLFRNMREWLLGKFGAEEADKVLPGYDVRAIELGARELIDDNRQRAGLPPAFSEVDDNQVDPSAKPSDPQPKESAVTDEEVAQLREQNAALQRQNEELRSSEHARAAEAIRQENTAFAESMAREARIPSAMSGQVAAIGTQLQSTDVEFGEGDAKKPMHMAFRDFLKALPPSVEFGEQATRDRAGQGADDSDNTAVAFAEGAAPDRIEQDKRIRAYAKHNGVSYTAAAHAVMRAK